MSVGEIMDALKRNMSLIAFFLASVLVLSSFYIEHAFDFKPCLLCTIQRSIFIALAFAFFLAFIYQFFLRTIRSYSIITGLLSLIGAAAASRQLWLQSLPPQPNELCVPGVSFLFHQLPFLEAVKILFSASQECGRVEWSLLHLSMAGWSLVFFIVFFIASIIMGSYRGSSGAHGAHGVRSKISG